MKKQAEVLKKINNILLNEFFILSFNCKLSKEDQQRFRKIEKELNDCWDELTEKDKT